MTRPYIVHIQIRNVVGALQALYTLILNANMMFVFGCVLRSPLKRGILNLHLCKKYTKENNKQKKNTQKLNNMFQLIKKDKMINKIYNDYWWSWVASTERQVQNVSTTFKLPTVRYKT